MRNKKLVIKTTYACLGKCLYCDSRRKLSKLKGRNIDKYLINKIVDSLENSTHPFEEIQLSGGEVSLYSDLDYLFSCLEKTNLPISITTSGYSNKDKNWKYYINKYNIRKLYVSLDSYNEKINDSIRGKGSYQRAIETIEELSLIKNRAFELNIISVLTSKNIYTILELYKNLQKYNIDRWLPAYLEGGNVYKNLLLNKDALLWLDRAKKEDINIDKIFGDDLFDINLNSLLINGEIKNTNSNKCKSLGNFLIIYPNGNVYPCYATEHYKQNHIDNIYDLNGIDWFNLLNKSLSVDFEYCKYCPENYQSSKELEALS